MIISWNVPRKAQDSTSVNRGEENMLYLCIVRSDQAGGPKKG